MLAARRARAAYRPVPLGDGMRLFDAGLGRASARPPRSPPVRVVETPEVTRIRYVLGPPAKLDLTTAAPAVPERDRS